MRPRNAHREVHAFGRIGWLRAAVLRANDGIVSTGSLIVGVAAAQAPRADILVAGTAALVAGAMSMAAGEYVSVSSQADTEKADLDREQRELSASPDVERDELARIYESRGIEPETAALVASQLMAHDALGAHARDELGISEAATARPLQAAFTSALTFTAGAAAPLLAVVVAPINRIVPVVALASLGCLALLGFFGARAGRAPLGRSLLRVIFWGALAMAVTAGVGRLFGTTVG
jgi:VIT1/CCC1 family predicted Fe2+/Mn2+ transporter